MEMAKYLIAIFKRVIIFLIVLLAAINAYMYFQQPAMLFYPFTEYRETPANWQLPYEDVTLTTSDKLSLHGWYVPVKSAKRVVLFFHGNGGNISHREASIRVFHDLGFNVFIFDYRGYGKSEGSPSEKGFYKDARSAWQFLKQKGFSPGNIIVFGRSLGGAVATQLVSEMPDNEQPRYLILESTFSSVADMARYVMPVVSEIVYLRYRFDTLSKITNVKSRLLVLHSKDDDIIPYIMGKAIYEAAYDNKAFALLQGDHNTGFIQSQPAYQNTLQHFLQ